jgi:3-oxoacyl-[acyl-carrier-protein] synthase III
MGLRLLANATLGTDGAGGRNLIVPNGAGRRPAVQNPALITDVSGVRTDNHLYMNGPEIFNFTLRVVPDVVQKCLERISWTLEEVDLFIFHQANRYMMDHLRTKLKLPIKKLPIEMQYCGNTVSSSIPLAMESLGDKLADAERLLLVGFGVGYSWGAIPLQKIQ